MADDHYFSPDPASELRTRTHTLSLRGVEVVVSSASGTFSPQGLDQGTAVLLKYAPDPPKEGTFLDIGCGWGPLTLALALASPASAVWGVDVNERARVVAAANAEELGLTGVTIAHPDAVPKDLQFDVMWSNPPIRVGKEPLHQILEQWLPRLSPSGEAYLVVAKKLGADSLLQWLNSSLLGLQATRVETAKGYRLFRVAWA
jgi:16S rRNA (guanine1207-N2)-methyltransferase